jgi:hypothetical protein
MSFICVSVYFIHKTQHISIKFGIKNLNFRLNSVLIRIVPNLHEVETEIIIFTENISRTANPNNTSGRIYIDSRGAVCVCIKRTFCSPHNNACI